MKNVINILLFSLLSLYLFQSCTKDQVSLSSPNSSSNSSITYWDSNYYCLVLDEASLYATLYLHLTNSTYGKYTITVGSAKYSISGDMILFTPALYTGDPSVYNYKGPTVSATFDETKSHISIRIENDDYLLGRSVVPPAGF